MTYASLSQWRMKKETRGIKAYIDIFDALGYQPIHGVPLGGIGAGTITRGRPNVLGIVIDLTFALTHNHEIRLFHS